MSNSYWILGVIVGLVAGTSALAAPTIYHNATIYTVDDTVPVAQAIAVDGQRIVAVGTEAEVRAAAGADAEFVDLGGKTVLPGLIDAHGHLPGLGGFELGLLDLTYASSYREMVNQIAVQAVKTKPGSWVLGGRWDHESWASKAMPSHSLLSEAVPNRPVWMRRVDGHAALANAEAMRLAGITRDTQAPDGGAILRDKHGNPTGIFLDNAMDLFADHIVGDGMSMLERLRAAQRACIRVGLTGVHDAGMSGEDVEVLRGMDARGELDLRVYVMIHGAEAAEYFETHPPSSGERITVRAAKFYMDGAMGSRGAWLLEPYADRPTDAAGKPWAGLGLMAPDDLRNAAAHALEHGYQLCTHAIGDRANRETLDAYEAAMRDAGVKFGEQDLRFRVEHVQLLSLSDVPRFVSLGVIPSMQPTHCTTDMRWVEARVGAERARGAYVWQSLIESGARLAAGSDFPVESANPFYGIHAAVTRQDSHNEPIPDGWHPEQRLTREQALRAFTLDAAYAGFENTFKGSLTPGKLADFIVIDRDIMTCDAGEIRETTVLRVVIGGEEALGTGD